MKIKDPIHGYIELTDEEEEILDQPELQRLRNIKQLGFADLVYPSANHTRFEHTLGVLSVAQDYADSLDLDEELTKELRLAALFHDTGHGPWSHLSEEITGEDHEERSCDIVETKEDLFRADADRIKKIIRGELEISQVIHGDVDADRMDYLQRDAYNTGVDHGTIDSDTIIENAEIDSRRLVYDYKAIQSLESLLMARHHMTRSVYCHHTSRIADKMVEEAAKEDLLRFPMNWDDKIADYRMMNSSHLYRRVKRRNLYKRAGRSSISEEALRDVLIDKTGIDRKKILTDNFENSLKGDGSLDIKVKYYREVKNLSEVSSVPEVLNNEESEKKSTRVYTPEENLDKVREAIDNVE